MIYLCCIMKKIVFLSAIVAMGLLVACSGKKNSTPADDEIVELEQQLSDAHQSNSAISQIDSLALMADDLTPAEALKVLITYIHVAQEAKEAKKSNLEMETMRKYVDVYDIVMGANRSEMTKAFESFAKRNANYNVMATAKDYRERLSSYADGSVAAEDVIAPQPKEETDSVKRSSEDAGGAGQESNSVFE